MIQNLSKVIFIFTIGFFIGTELVFSSEIDCVKDKNSKGSYDIKKSFCSDQSLEDKFINSLSKYREYEEAIKPQNQFIDLFGIGGFPDQRLKQSTFDLWNIFNKESTNQIGDQRLSRPDIHNTFNGTLGSLED